MNPCHTIQSALDTLVDAISVGTSAKALAPYKLWNVSPRSLSVNAECVNQPFSRDPSRSRHW
jgi:hypothetical protein